VSLVHTKALQIIRASDEAAPIGSRQGRFLAIPTGNAPRKGTEAGGSAAARRAADRAWRNAQGLTTVYDVPVAARRGCRSASLSLAPPSAARSGLPAMVERTPAATERALAESEPFPDWFLDRGADTCMTRSSPTGMAAEAPGQGSVTMMTAGRCSRVGCPVAAGRAHMRRKAKIATAFAGSVDAGPGHGRSYVGL
jgi:hypothetical protein